MTAGAGLGGGDVVRALVGRFAAPGVPLTSLVVIGEGGSGLTTALDAVEHARDAAGLVTLRVRGFRLEADRPLGAFIELGADDEAGVRRQLAEQLGAAGAGGAGLLVVDDAHWLDPASLRLLAGIGDRGVTMLVAHRPQPANQMLAVLDGALSRTEPPLRLGALGGDELAARVAAVLGAPPDQQLLDVVAELSGGHRLLVERLVRGWTDEGLVARGRLQPPAPDHVPYLFRETVRTRLAQLDPDARELCIALAQAQLTGEAELFEAAERSAPDTYGEVMAAGLCFGGLARVLSDVAGALERAGAATRTADLLSRLGRPAPVVAAHLRDARASGPAAAQVYVRAGDDELSDDPDASVAWYELALGASPELPAAAAGLAQALAWAGDGPAALEAAEQARRLVHRGAQAAGLAVAAPSEPATAGLERASEVVERAGAASEAVVAAVLAGRSLWLDAATALGGVVGHPAVPEAFFAWQAVLCALVGGDLPAAHHFAAAAQGAVATTGPQVAPPVAVMAVERAARALLASIGHAGQAPAAAAQSAVDELDEPSMVGPPAANLSPVSADLSPSVSQPVGRVGALPAPAAQPAEVFAHMLDAASLAGNVAAPCPPALSVHEVAIAMALAVGDVATARNLANDAPPSALRGAAVELAGRWAATRAGETVSPPPGAQGLAALAIDAANARRASDVNTSATLARQAAQVVPGATVDLLSVDVAGELSILLQRYAFPAEAAALDARVEALFSRLGRPLIWGARLAWAGLEAAVAVRRHDAVAHFAAVLQDAAHHLPRLAPLARAAHMWVSVLGGAVELAELDEVVSELKERGFVWEAAQLAGQAAIRVDNAAAAKSLLGQARSLRQRTASDDGDGAVTPAGLSEREREVAKLVLDGLTHKDIGATLYISPKTVEHHVAHIRQKLGTTTRAEFLAALRADLEAAEP